MVVVTHEDEEGQKETPMPTAPFLESPSFLEIAMVYWLAL